ncbi:hypothetical protein Cfor_05616 [Coptotermes formosanus]|uniref:C2H2-type domain-containing protein n=1 Tax=Coptotermes formosanus TaxID=36987 RepID=A0A6L2Q3I8_COPFO|nr:hypothetical protein Cfor_05616 [Coptotermes formosanus]
MIREAKLEYIGNHPEEGKQHYCETCDREFKTESKLLEHVQQHTVCGLDGCQFVAHPKVILRHVQMQHHTGLYKKIGNLYTPEDITKWIAERKRLYPTKENVARRQAEQEEKLNRGERLGENKNRFGRNSVSFISGGTRGTGIEDYDDTGQQKLMQSKYTAIRLRQCCDACGPWMVVPETTPQYHNFEDCCMIWLIMPGGSTVKPLPIFSEGTMKNSNSRRKVTVGKVLKVSGL